MGYGRLNLGNAVLISSAKALVQDNVLNIYPNPARNYAIVDFTLDSPTEINLILYDYLGRVVDTPIKNQYFSAKNTQTLRLETSSYSNGIYFITLQSGNTLTTKKLIISK